MKHATVIESDDLFGGFNWPSISRLGDGRLIVVCSGFRLGHICPFGKAVAMYSSDEGESWSAPVPVLSTPLDDRDAGVAVCGDKVLVTSFNNSRAFQRRIAARDWSGKERALIEAYLDCVSDEEEARYLGSSCVLSLDGGKTFGGPVRVPVMAPHGPCVRKDGSLFYLGRAFAVETESGGFPNDLLEVCTSRDWKTWSAPAEIPMPREEGTLFCEPHAAALPDGRILAGLRAQRKDGFTIFTAHSADGGKTFGPWRDLGFHGSPPHFFVHSSGAVVLSYGYRKPPYGQRARVSFDGGETWSEEIILRDDGINWDLGYPATAECADGSLITVYYQRRPGARHTGIYQTKWELPRRG